PLLNTVDMTDVSGSAEAGDTLTFTFDSTIKLSITAEYSFSGTSSITNESLVTLLGYLGSFVTQGDITAVSSTLQFTAADIIAITLGGTVSVGTIPSGDFTPSSANITDIAGNALDVTTITVASGDVSGSY
ncbi:MAG: hypothetical protein L3J12_06515, partial [Spirochaetales bacterium]|nr:hypothetical protein [Spirochaetales bacterium]